MPFRSHPEEQQRRGIAFQIRTRSHPEEQQRRGIAFPPNMFHNLAEKAIPRCARDDMPQR